MSNEAQKHEHGGPPVVHLRIQTPRGLWSMASPEGAKIRPEYPKSTKVQQVIDDARRVFDFTDNDSKYALAHGNELLSAQRTLASYGLKDDTLLVLTVQGGNA